MTVKYIEMWYDKRSRSWVCQAKDEHGYQVGEAEYDGSKESAMQSAAWLSEGHGMIPVRHTTFRGKLIQEYLPHKS